MCELKIIACEWWYLFIKRQRNSGCQDGIVKHGCSEKKNADDTDFADNRG